MTALKFLLLIAALPCIFGVPIDTTVNDLVVVTDSTTVVNTESEKEGGDVKPPKISDMYIKSNISNRFATTIVRNKVKNEANVAQETTFFVILPDQAYISSFIMEIGGKNYTAYVQEKETAKKTYDQAVSSGYGAAHIEVSARDSNKFTVSVNVEPESKAIFYLTYEELLERKDGYYELVVNIHPKQLVKNMNVDVEIEESRPITMIEAPPLRSGNEIAKETEKSASKAIITKPEPNKANVKFSPDYEHQKQIAESLGTKEDEGISGQFVVQYDVERDPQGGEVLVKDGYFVHFFAPSELEALRKHIIFVLDTSGSMYDRKLIQLKSAMKSILGELKPNDFFNLVEFNTNVLAWNLDAPTESTSFPSGGDNWYSDDKFYPLTDVSFPPAYPVNNKTITKANKAVEEMVATGGTNIYEALRVGIHMIKLRQKRTGDKNVQPLIVFLTDGDPTVGKTNQDQIISGIAEENIANVPIMSLAFGNGADKQFLEKISLRNHGFARQIYEDSDASLQLENFYKTISSPLLHDVTFSYTPDATSLTKTTFPILFHGGEFVIAGEIPSKEFKETPKVSAWGIKGPTTFLPTVKEIKIGQLERLWAYLTVRRYLDAKKTAKNGTEYEKKALDLALKYSFVTPVTSLVVVKPNATSAVDAEAADNSRNDYGGYGGIGLQFASGIPQPAGFGGGFAAGGASYSAHGGLKIGLPKYGKINTRRRLPSALGSPVAFGGHSLLPAAYPAHPIAPMVPSSSYALSIAEEADVDGDSVPESIDRVVGGYSGLGTTRLDVELSTAPPTTTTTAEPVTLSPLFKAKLPWLDEQLNADGTLKFLKGKFLLSTNETTPADIDCTTPASEEGECRLLKDCEDLYPILTGPQIFKDYYCTVSDKYVGVCCPKKKQE